MCQGAATREREKTLSSVLNMNTTTTHCMTRNMSVYVWQLSGPPYPPTLRQGRRWWCGMQMGKRAVTYRIYIPLCSSPVSLWWWWSISFRMVRRYEDRKRRSFLCLFPLLPATTPPGWVLLLLVWLTGRVNEETTVVGRPCARRWWVRAGWGSSTPPLYSQGAHLQTDQSKEQRWVSHGGRSTKDTCNCCSTSFSSTFKIKI